MERLGRVLMAVGVAVAIGACAAPGAGAPPGRGGEGDLRWLSGWLAAWELVSREVLSLPSAEPPAMLFFDDTDVYTTSPVSAPEGRPFQGPRLFGRELPWLQAPHHGRLTLPTGERVPVGLMSFAAPGERGEGSGFFVMAAPTYWRDAGIASKELGLDKMLTGVFLHEFTHTRQADGFGARVSELERAHTFDEALSDDIVQHSFGQDAAYVASFQAEVETLYAAVSATGAEERRRLARRGLTLLKARQARYFQGERAVLRELDDIFLSMEGLGQAVGVAWLTHPAGGNVPFPVAVEGFRRKRTQWSQEEGLALLLLLDALCEDSRSALFGTTPTTAVELLERAVDGGC